MHKTSVGDVTLISLLDTSLEFPANQIYPETPDVLERYGEYLAANGNLQMAVQSFLLIDGDRRVLVDTGMGPELNGTLPAELVAAGFPLESIDTVVFTHLHVDHTAWNIDRATGKATFPRATYLVPRADWEAFSNESPVRDSVARDVVPLQALGCMELFDPEHAITPAVRTVATPGHTPGHSSVAITSGGATGFITGDVVISQVDVAEPDIAIMFDEDQQQAVRTRTATLDRLIADGTLVGSNHLPVPGIGRFVVTDSGRRWQGVDLG